MMKKLETTTALRLAIVWKACWFLLLRKIRERERERERKKERKKERERNRETKC
jgi:hypothetical protein